jgi:predicted ATP-grasp superfamily ATP-dependent carboligase
MTLFVYEHITATMPASDTSLYREGRAMRDALIADLHATPGVEVASCSPGQSFDEYLQACDAVWLIAPEFENILTDLAVRVETAGKRLLGPTSSAIRLTTDKLALAKCWADAGVRTPSTIPFNDCRHCKFPVVIKPFDGCGSTATTLVRNETEIEHALARADKEGYAPDRLIVQPYIPGRPASVAFLIGPREMIPLVPTFQHVSAYTHLAYEGGELPIPAPLADRAIRCARQAIECVPGLSGYVGVDLILGERDDGSDDYAIEINPRLTTSYVGLRALAECNLAAAVVSLALEKPGPFVRWRTGHVRFLPDGSASFVP